MNIHNYSPITGEYVGTSKAQKSPLEDDVYLIPAHSTKTAPPVANKGFARVFDGKDWGQVIDKRGEAWWDSNRDQVTIEDLGDPTGRGLVSSKPPPPPPSTDPTDYELTAFQFFSFFDGIGLTEEVVDAAIDQVEPNVTKRIQHKRRFRHATSYRRDHPLLVSLVSAVGKTPAQIDIAWLVAKDLK